MAGVLEEGAEREAEGLKGRRRGFVQRGLKVRVFWRWRSAEGLEGRSEGSAQRELEEGRSAGGHPKRGRTSKRGRRTSASSEESLHEGLELFSQGGGA